MLCPSSCYYKMPNTNLAGGGDPNVGPADGAVVLLLAPLPDAMLAEGVATVDADRLHKQLRADGTLQLRLRQLPYKE